MTVFVLELALFLGVRSASTVSFRWRNATV